MPHTALRLSKTVQAACPIHVLIVGAGIAGLACAFALRRNGHNVTVLEKTPEVNELGGCCRLTPNASKVLFQWGLREELEKCASPKLDSALFYSCESEEFLGGQYFSREMLRETGGGEWMCISYGDLRRVIYDSATKTGVQIRSGIAVTTIDAVTRSVTDASGAVFTADFIIAADGANGIGRKLLGGDEGTPAGFNFYSTSVSANDIPKVPEMLGGPESKDRIAAYIRWGDGYTLYTNTMNSRGDSAVYVYTADDGQGGNWSDGPTVDLRDVLTGEGLPEWMKRLCALAAPATRCQGFQFKDMEDWVDDHTPHMVAIGDAAHPFPTGSLQAFGMALEDAAILGRLFSHLRSENEIPHLLCGFQDLRQARCREAIARESARMKVFTMRKGTEQEARDHYARSFKEGSAQGVYTLQELDKLFTYDCEDQAEDWWRQWNIMHNAALHIDAPEGLEVGVEVEVKEEDELAN